MQAAQPKACLGSSGLLATVLLGVVFTRAPASGVQQSPWRYLVANRSLHRFQSDRRLDVAASEVLDYEPGTARETGREPALPHGSTLQLAK